MRPQPPALTTVVIIGLGPGGLSLALQLLNRENIRIIAIEKRPALGKTGAHLRSNAMVFGRKTHPRFSSRHGLTIPRRLSIKDLEHQLSSHIKDHPNRHRLHVYDETSLIKIDPDKGHVYAKQGKLTRVIPFNHLACFDGGKRPSLNLLPSDWFPIKQRPIQPVLPHYVVVQLQIQTKRPDLATYLPEALRLNTVNSRPQLLALLQPLKTLTPCDKRNPGIKAWPFFFLPLAQMISYNPKKGKYTLGAELPPALAKRSDSPEKRSYLLTWATLIATLIINQHLKQSRLPLAPVSMSDLNLPHLSRKHGEAKNKLRLLQIDCQLNRSTDAYHKLADGKTISVGGDSFANAWFFNANGAVNAMDAAIFWQRALSASGHFHGHRYQEALQQQLRRTERRAAKFALRQHQRRIAEQRLFFNAPLTPSIEADLPKDKTASRSLFESKRP